MNRNITLFNHYLQLWCDTDLLLDEGTNQRIETALAKQLDPEGLAARVTSVEQGGNLFNLVCGIDVDLFMEKVSL